MAASGGVVGLGQLELSVVEEGPPEEEEAQAPGVRMSEDATGGDGADGGRGSTVRRRIMSQRQTERMTMVLTPKEFRRSPPGLVLFRMVEHPMTQVLLMVLLVVTLFLPDIWVVANPDESQDASTPRRWH